MCILSIAFDDRPYVPVTINGRGPYNFLLDTGAVGPDVTERVASELDLPVSEVHETFRRIESLQIGELKWQNYHMSLGHARPYIEKLQRPHDGFIGYMLIKDLVVVIDYHRCELQLIDYGNQIEETPLETSQQWVSFTLELRSRDRFPYRYTVVQVQVNGKGPYRFLLDTGAGRCNVSPELQAELGLEINPLKGKDAVVMRELELCGVVKTNVSAYVMDCSHVQVEGPVHGYVGHNFLEDLRIALDYPLQQILIE